MTTCRISLLSLVLTTLASSAAWGQSQVPGYAQPSSRQSAAAHAAPASNPSQPQEANRGNWFRRLVIGQPEEATAKPATPQLSQQQPSSRQTSLNFGTQGQHAAPAKTGGAQTINFAPGSRNAAATQASPAALQAASPATGANQLPARTSASAATPNAEKESGNWFKRLVVGERADDRNDQKSVQFGNPQPSSRQGTPTRLPSTNVTIGGQAPQSKVATAPTQAAPPAERSGWLRRLVIGEPQESGKTISAAPPVASQTPKPRMVSGLFGPPEVSAATPARSAAGQSPEAHVPRTLPSQQSPVVIADSLNSAKASAPIDKVGPDSAGSVSLTNWISRLHRSPSAGEATPPRSNTLAPAEVADRSAVAAAWQPGGATQPPIASSPSPSSRIGDPRTTAGDSDAGNAGLAAAGRNPKPVGERSLTGWLTRPFRSNNDRDEESLAARPIAPSRSGSNVPVRLPAVTHTAANPSTNGYKRLPPPSATPDIGGASRPGASAAANSGLVGITGSGTPGGNFAQDFSGRVAPATAYQAASDAPNQPRLLPQVSEHSNAWPLAEEAYQSYPPDEAGGNPLGRPKIIFNPVAGMSGNGQATLKPTVQVAHGNDASHGYGYPAMRFAQQVPPEAEDSLPPPQGTVPLEGPNGVEGQVVPDGGPVEMTGEPLPEMWVPMDPAYEGPMTAHEAIGPFRECFYTVLAHLNGPRSCPEGIGVENVMNAPFWLDTTQPLQNCRVRGDAAADWEFPDRIEYFWAQTPGPKGAQADFDAEGGEPNVDYQEVSFYIERGGERFSVGTDLPIRAVDPVVRRNTTGFADMRVTTKAVLLDGKDWQLTQVMHTHIPTGSFRRGTGNGHVSLEPGVAWRYKWSDVTYIHGDLTYWFPIAADPFHSGQMFNYGIGISHIWIDGDKWAIMPTLELNAWTVVDGRQTFPGETILPPPVDPGGFEEIDTLSILNIHPGLRWVCDTAGDCGVREFGITSGFTVTEDHWYEEILRIELRWVF